MLTFEMNVTIDYYNDYYNTVHFFFNYQQTMIKSVRCVMKHFKP